MSQEPADIVDRRQNWWQLGTIQGVALGLPGIIIPGADYFSVILGNFVLWSIALPIMLMAFKKRANAIENVKDFMGKIPCIISCFILSAAFLSWNIIQNKTASIALAREWSLGEGDHTIIGFIIALIVGCMSFFGIKYIRYLCTSAFPLLIGIALWMMIKTPPRPLNILEHISIASISVGSALVIFQNLPGIVNLPTFFRHADSIPNAVLGLTWMTLLVMFLQIFGVWVHIDSPLDFFLVVSKSSAGPWVRVIFILVSMLCINSVNIYFASAGLETFSAFFIKSRNNFTKRISCLFVREYSFGRFSINWGCGVVGIVGAFTCLIPESLSFIKIMEEMTDNVLSNLGIVLVFAFFMQLSVHHRPRTLEYVTTWAGWLVACIATLIFQFTTQLDSIILTLIGIGTTFLAFGIMIFFEMNYFSIKNLLESKKSN